MTLPLPSIVDDPEVQQNFDTIARQFPVTAPNLTGVLKLASGSTAKVAYGKATFTWTASILSGLVEVTHGMGVEPVAVVLTSWVAPAVEKIPLANAITVTKEKFTANAEVKAAHTGSIQCSWIAIG